MKRHRSGLNSDAQLAALTETDTFYRSTFTLHWDTVPRIVEGKLLLRTQTWLFLAPGKVRYPPPRMPTNTMYICKHVSGFMFGGEVTTGGVTSLVIKISKCLIQHWKSDTAADNCKICAVLHSCKWCPTQFQIDLQDLGVKGVALVLTKWQDLGEGKEHDDWTWRSHLDFQDERESRPGEWRYHYRKPQKRKGVYTNLRIRDSYEGLGVDAGENLVLAEPDKPFTRRGIPTMEELEPFFPTKLESKSVKNEDRDE
ncbi:hypothetical protein LZ554_002299 [Drepanopeziza brunnea f. sp. 'monogermtubi']|nr:hypothetical protein LZ554_002299 [Drepanopeziza brunnea f. sp. 'monogermtubi']